MYVKKRVSSKNKVKYSNNNQKYNSNRNSKVKGRRIDAPKDKGWRDNNDYREEYFRKNKGLFGRVYICTGCGVPIIDKSKAHVDHMIPPSLALGKTLSGRRKSDGLLARALNHEFNCVIKCRTCNLRKGNRLTPMVIAKDVLGKSIEVGIKVSQVALTLGLAATLMTGHLTFKILGKLVKKLILRR